MNDSKPDHSQPENQPGEERLTTPDEVSGASSDAGLASQTVDAAMYGLSLPERVARAMIGTTSRVARDTAELAVPDSFKRGRLYAITVNRMLGFLAEDVGKLTPDLDHNVEQPEDNRDKQYLVKKAIGNVIDLGGLAVLHISPLWVIAIFSDIALGTKTYLNTLISELKEQGVLPESETIDNVDRLLEALQRTTATLADQLDTPPITVDQLRRSVEQLRTEAQKGDLTQVVAVSDLERVWNEIEETVRVEQRSPLEVSNAVAMMTYNQIVRVGHGAVGSVKVALDLVSDNVVDYYFDALERIHTKGYYTCVIESYDRFLRDLYYVFDASAPTKTEQVLRGRWLSRCWCWLTTRCCRQAQLKVTRRRW